MLTDTQVQVLAAINDHCEIYNKVLLGPGDPLPNLLADLDIPDDEVYTAVADLHELGLINGVKSFGPAHPIRVDGLTARGRQELP